MNIKLKLNICIIILLSNNFFFQAQTLSKAYKTYIEKYKELAIKQQAEHGIPASITLAQGLLESSAGESWLAKNSNNHFGIKCAEWQGEKIYKDDDQKDDCFRKYNSVVESYEDHSKFIKNRSWYGSLFELDRTDYEGWAKGLKKAGYASDPDYAYKLISIIENYNLHEYDLIQKKAEIITASTQIPAEKQYIGSISDYISHKVFKNNKLKYVVAVPNDTYGTIADEFNLTEKQLRIFNDVQLNTPLNPGSKVYLQKKKHVADKKFPIHQTKEGESMYSISQDYGIRLESLYKLNQMPYSEGAKVSQILKLRK